MAKTGIFAKLFKRAALKSVVAGVADSLPIVSTIKANIQSSLGGEGQVNWVRLITAIGMIAVNLWLLKAFLSGDIDIETLNELIQIFN